MTSENVKYRSYMLIFFCSYFDPTFCMWSFFVCFTEKKKNLGFTLWLNDDKTFTFNINDWPLSKLDGKFTVQYWSVKVIRPRPLITSAVHYPVWTVRCRHQRMPCHWAWALHILSPPMTEMSSQTQTTYTASENTQERASSSHVFLWSSPVWIRCVSCCHLQHVALRLLSRPDFHLL